MALEEYRRKRKFSETPEPKGEPKKSPGKLRFVIQEHHATRLHWDFRLEMGGTLKSWAVPKGPTLDPDEKRLAVPVEDHPIEYMEFEGVIPKGNYGAGTVMVWDRGTYDCLEGDALSAFEKGKLTVVLRGKKLKGEFHLVRTRMGGEVQWLMFKKRDADAIAGWRLPEPSVSAKTGRTIKHIAGEETHRWHSGDGVGRDSEKQKPSSSSRKRATPRSRRALKGLKLDPPGSDPFPKKVWPMLTTLIADPFDDPRWVFEIKWDGIRAISYLERAGPQQQVLLQSRGGHNINEQFPEIVEALYELNLPNAILDGEIAALDEEGRSSFPLLQKRTMGAKKPPIVYYAFDLLYVNGHNIMNRALSDRRAALEAILPEHPLVRLSDMVPKTGKAFYAAAQQLGVEGITGKRADSIYQPGVRSSGWVKLKVKRRLEAVIGGFTKGEGARAKTFGAVLLGVFEDGRFRGIGRAGGGFTDAELRRVYPMLKARIQSESPFETLPPDTPKSVKWVRPELVAEIEYGGWTVDGVLRFPVYLGLRDDKPAREVRLERPTSADALANPPPRPRSKTNMSKDPVERSVPRATAVVTASPEKTRPLHPIEEAVRAAGLKVDLTNLDKVFWPEKRHTKGDLLEYYLKVAPVILPHLRDRPITLRRFPNGIKEAAFYQKDYPDAPDFVALVHIFSESGGDTMAAPVCNNLESLLWLAQLAAVETHAWFSRITPMRKSEGAGAAGTSFSESEQSLRESVLNRPDYVVFDIDPYLFPDNKLPERKGEKDPDYSRRGFDAAREATFLVRDLLKSLKLNSFVKTSGKTGLHVHVPIERRYTYEQVHEFARTVTQYLEREQPKKLTTAWAAAKRVGKVFLDYNQNRLGATLASAYSVRPTPEAAVSMPVTWKELEEGFDPLDFNMKSVPDIMKKRKDVWRDLMETPQRLDQHLGKAR